MRTSTMLLLSAALLAVTAPIRALEVSLEENKGERGNIGYVDMQKLFRVYPETQKARQNFEEVVRQAEEQVNIRKAELIGLRAEIVRLRLEREMIAKIPIQSGTPQTSTAAAIGPSEPRSPAAGGAAAVPGVPGFAPAEEKPLLPPAGTGATPAVPEGRRSGAPEVSTTTALALTASTPTVTSSSSTAAAVASSSSTAPATLPAAGDPGQPLVINLPGLSQDPIVIQPPSAGGGQTTASLSRTLADLDAKLAEKTRTLQEKEAEFKTYQAQVEKNLLDLEGKKTEMLLGKIYSAVQDVAREEGISVVIDKGQILFGQKAVDLTEKVLRKLKT